MSPDVVIRPGVEDSICRIGVILREPEHGRLVRDIGERPVDAWRAPCLPAIVRPDNNPEFAISIALILIIISIAPIVLFESYPIGALLCNTGHYLHDRNHTFTRSKLISFLSFSMHELHLLVNSWTIYDGDNRRCH